MISTRSGSLLPVLCAGGPAMLKLCSEAEEARGAALLAWWDGGGAARIFARTGNVILLERALGAADLSAMSRAGRDDETCRILCACAARLHAPRAKALPDLVPLEIWFSALTFAAERHGGILRDCAATARRLLAEPRDIAPLHGDLHHGNVLDFGARGWLAIDAKGLIGERGFDFANIFTNPDLDDPARPVATLPGRFERRLAIVSASAGLEPKRLLAWVLAWAGLSAAWFLEDGDARAGIDLAIAALARAALAS